MIKKNVIVLYFSMVTIFIFVVLGEVYGQKKTDGACAITAFADSLGFDWRWEPDFLRLTCQNATMQVKFYEGNSYYLFNGEIRHLPETPQRQGGTLKLSRNVVRAVFGTTNDTAMRAPLPVIQAAALQKNNISSVASEKKSNGTLITIQLTDSLPVDVTYFYPNLTINLFGGKLDTAVIKQIQRIGVVDSLFSIQFEVSAQITALLTREIEDPMIDYVQDTKTILVSLWPKKTIPLERKTSVPPMEKKNTTIIVIDPGHGGKDPGATSAAGVKEKDVVLKIGLKVRDQLRKKQGITVFMTREKDVFVPLSDRTKFANDKMAHLFISIHADAIDGDEKRKEATSGYKVYFLSQAKSEDDKLAAMRENAVIELEEQPQQYSDLQNVLIDMVSNEYLRESQDMCILIEQKFSSALNNKITKLHKGVGQANFWVLNGAFMPSVLIETGFLSHKKEEKLLDDATFQKSMAGAISDAVIGFCKKFEGAGL